MKILKSVSCQCGRPNGFLGRMLLRSMNLFHATITNWGLGYVNFKDEMKMLDIGCGGGATLKRLLRRSSDSKVYGIDISEESVAKARKVNSKLLGKKVFIQTGSAEELPWNDNTFDIVTAVETVYFWPNIVKCFTEVRRILKTDGQFVVIVEVTSKKSVWTNLVDGMTAYSVDQLKSLLEQAGFTEFNIHNKKGSHTVIISK
jgi:ubiquinone/menaquinone biosynthesis C-methylase UbiE